MGLLDSVLGAALNQTLGNQAAPQRGGAGNPLDAILGSLAGGGGGNAGGGMNLTALLPVLLPVLGQLLGNNGSHGGLGGLTQRFNQAGMGDVLGSWVGSGQNQAISPDQLTQVLGGDTMGQIAQQLGLGQGDAAGALSQILPGLVDHLTPHGQAPAGGLGSSEDLMGMLGGLLQQGR